ncbi:MAG: hypothetical protein AB7S38_12550 [Vulcanimicrobiota bacterium]
MSPRRGNILLTAIFIAVFLFFVSVALVSTNRVDLRLSLNSELRLKARSAARSGGHYAYGVMRADPNWRSLLDDYQETMDSGATFYLHIFEYREQGEAGVSKYEIVSKGILNGVSETYRMIVEETRPAENVGSGRAPFLFLGQGSVITPDFKNTALPAPSEELTNLAAAGGPVFAASGKLPSDVIVADFIPTRQDGKVYAGPQVVYTELPDTEQLVELELAGSQFAWSDLEDVSKALAKNSLSPENLPQPIAALTVPSADKWSHIAFANAGTLDEPNIRKTVWFEPRPGTGGEQITVKIASEVLAPSGQGQEWASVPRRQPVEWYTVRPDAGRAAVGDKLLLFGFHYIFFQYREGGDAPFGNLLVRWPAVLAYSGQRWSPVWDPLQLNGDSYSVQGEVYPDLDVLAADASGVWATRALSSSEFEVYQLNERQATLVGRFEGNRTSLLRYHGRLYTHETVGEWREDGKPRYGLRAVPGGEVLTPYGELDARIPAITGYRYSQEQGLTEATLDRRRIVYASLGDQPSAFGTNGKELWCQGIVREWVDPSTQSEAIYQAKPAGITETPVILRYNGQRWEVWPHGIMAAADRGLQSVTGPDVLPASYPSAQKVRSRYAVIAISDQRFEE